MPRPRLGPIPAGLPFEQRWTFRAARSLVARGRDVTTLALADATGLSTRSAAVAMAGLVAAGLWPGDDEAPEADEPAEGSVDVERRAAGIRAKWPAERHAEFTRVRRGRVVMRHEVHQQRE